MKLGDSWFGLFPMPIGLWTIPVVDPRPLELTATFRPSNARNNVQKSTYPFFGFVDIVMCASWSLDSGETGTGSGPDPVMMSDLSELRLFLHDFSYLPCPLLPSIPPHA